MPLPESGHPFSAEDVQIAREALHAYHSAVGAYFEQHRGAPAAESPMREEDRAYPNSEVIRTVYSQALVLLEVAGDQLTAFLKTIGQPLETIAPWVCVRGLLEASALASWLLDPSIDSVLRVARSRAFRYEGLDQQRKWATASGIDPAPVRERMEEVAASTEAMGYDSLTDAKGRPSGAGVRMPSVTTLVRDHLDKEDMYRLLSAVAHGHFWAIQQLGFEILPAEDTPAEAESLGGWALEKSVNLTGMLYLAVGAAEAMGRATWYHSLYSGWDGRVLDRILTALFDALNLSDARRFWHFPRG